MRRVRCASLLLALCACESGPQVLRTTTDAGAPRRSIRVVTFNLYNRPWKRSDRLRTQLSTLRSLQPDLVALQEVATGVFLPGDPVAVLSAGLDLGGLRAWHEQNLGLFRTGLGLLSAWPAREVAYHAFARSPFWDEKGFLSATVDTPLGAIAVVNVHLASTRDAAMQRSELDEVAAQVRALAARSPVLVLGDFNLEPAALARFVENTGADSLYAHIAEVYPTWNDSFERDCSEPGGELIDHLFVVPGPAAKLRFRGGRIVVPHDAPHPSDHCPVAAELDLENR
jgi:endonuclease/exonuclease/phosphatase family metal-dependent hydrolase